MSYFGGKCPREGEAIDGNFRVLVKKDLRVQSVKVELVCYEKAGVKEVSTVKDLVWVKNPFLGWLKNPLSSEGEAIQAGQVFEWPVVLRIPKEVLPTIAVYKTQVAWRARAVITEVYRTRILRRIKNRDLEVQQEIQVYSTSDSSSPSLRNEVTDQYGSKPATGNRRHGASVMEKATK